MRYPTRVDKTELLLGIDARIRSKFPSAVVSLSEARYFKHSLCLNMINNNN